MAWTASEPGWVVPSRAQIADLHWLAYADAADGDRRASGVTAALAWVRGGAAAPATGREEQPSDRRLAEVEFWSARELLSPDSPPPIATICRDLGVAYVAPRDIDVERAEGVEAALAWLLGQKASPLPLPQRLADGRPADVQAIVEAAIAAQPDRTWGPEERHAARNDARVAVERTQRLLARISAAQKRAG